MQAILRLVSYLEHDEEKHWEAMRDRGEDTSGHIFNSVKTVSDWLDTLPGVPPAFERERARADLMETLAGLYVDGDFADFWAEQEKARRH
jgi:hypothetical protein